MVEDGFILLRDFADAYERFPLRALELDDRLEQAIRTPMLEALRQTVPDLQPYELEEVRAKTERYADGSLFVITMDGGVCFPFADCKLEMTRAVYDLAAVRLGVFSRFPRGGERQLIQQCIQLKKEYDVSGSHGRIVLCDDGIGSGTSLRRVISILSELKLDVAEIAVLVNPEQKKDVEGIPVTTLLSNTHKGAWLNERDLYWGLPRAGLSFIAHDTVAAVGGVPYSIDTEVARLRVGLPDEQVECFRQECLRINRELWLLLEESRNRPLQLHECDRLRFLGPYFGGDDRRIVEVIDEVSDSDFSLVDR